MWTTYYKSNAPKQGIVYMFSLVFIFHHFVEHIEEDFHNECSSNFDVLLDYISHTFGYSLLFFQYLRYELYLRYLTHISSLFPLS